MKKSVLTLAIALVTGVATMSATCWRINPSPYAGAQFKTVEDAMNDINVSPGDTLLLDPGNHGHINVTRENITVIGSGYFLSQNKQWGESQETLLGDVGLNKNCTIEGCNFRSIYNAEGMHVKRCKFTGMSGSYFKDIIVEQCIITGNRNYNGICDVHDNWIIRNNIIIMTDYPCITGVINYYGNGSIIENNVLITSSYGHVISNISNATIRNNIIINSRSGFDGNQIPYATLTLDFNRNNVIQNNVFSTPKSYANAQYPNNHYVGATIENTFVNEGSDDAKWQLRSNSAAKGAATHGGDCGAFGGPTPYVLSGIPQFLPHITEALIPAKPTDGKITVKLKIANQNE